MYCKYKNISMKIKNFSFYRLLNDNALFHLFIKICIPPSDVKIEEITFLRAVLIGDYVTIRVVYLAIILEILEKYALLVNNKI